MKISRLVLLAGVYCFATGCVTTSEEARPRAASPADAAQANLNLGAAYVREGRPRLAVDPLLRAIDMNPRLADAYSTLAIAYDQLGDGDLAEPNYRRATELDTGNSDAANSYAVFLCRQGRWNDAERYFERAIGNPRYPTPEVAMTNAATCARSANDVSKADRYYRAALSRNNAYPGALVGMMELAYENDNFLQARAFMQRYREVQPANPSVLWYCFHIERQLNNEEASTDCATRLSQDFPNSTEAVQLRQLTSDAR